MKKKISKVYRPGAEHGPNTIQPSVSDPILTLYTNVQKALHAVTDVLNSLFSLHAVYISFGWLQSLHSFRQNYFQQLTHL